MPSLQEIDNFFAGIPKEVAYVIVGVVVFFLMFLGLKYSGFSVKKFNKNLG